jgi:uncharacterized protein YndB with AHSA1/START domain
MAVGSVANSDTFKVTTPSDREIVLTRLFDAPRRLVFEAMTKPEHVRRWWGLLDDRYSVNRCLSVARSARLGHQERNGERRGDQLRPARGARQGAAAAVIS